MQTSSWSLLQLLFFLLQLYPEHLRSLTVDLPASLRLLRHQPVLSQVSLSPPLSSSFLLPLFTRFFSFQTSLFHLLVWRFCLFVCCLHVWMRHSSLTSSEEFHTRLLSPPYIHPVKYNTRRIRSLCLLFFLFYLFD